MKRSIGLCCLSLFLVLAPLAHVALFAAKPNKVTICHFDGNGTGHQIEVSENAAAAHIQHHGDCRGRRVVDNGDGTCRCQRRAGGAVEWAFLACVGLLGAAQLRRKS